MDRLNSVFRLRLNGEEKVFNTFSAAEAEVRAANSGLLMLNDKPVFPGLKAVKFLSLDYQVTVFATIKEE